MTTIQDNNINVNININNENNIYDSIIDNNIINNNIVENIISNNTTNDEYIKKKYKVSKITRDRKAKPSIKEKKSEELEIPIFSSHNTFLTKSYTIPQLKEICKFYKLKVTGNKQVLINKIYNFLYFSS